MKTRLTPPEIRDYRAHTREETLPARSLQQRVRKKLAQHAIKRLFSAIFRSLGELFRAHARIKASQGEFAHRTQRPGDAETNTTTAHPQQGTTGTAITSAHPQHGTTETAITTAHPQHGTTETAITSAHPQHGTTETAITTAPKNRTKNAHFSPAKAMAVSNHRASSPAAPTRSARRRRRDPISTHSHAIPPTHTSRLDTQSLKFQAIHRATNHRRQTTHQHTRPHRCGGRRRPGCGARGRQQGQGGPRERPLRAKLACGDLAGGPPPTGAPSSPAPRSTTRPWGASTTRQRVGRLAAPHPSTPIVQQAITLSPAPRRG